MLEYGTKSIYNECFLKNKITKKKKRKMDRRCNYYFETYAWTELLLQGQDVTQGQFLSGAELVLLPVD